MDHRYLSLVFLCAVSVGCGKKSSQSSFAVAELQRDDSALGFTEHQIATHGNRKLNTSQYAIVSLEHPDVKHPTDTHEVGGCDLIPYEIDKAGTFNICLESELHSVAVSLLTPSKSTVALIKSGEACKAVDLLPGVYFKEVCRHPKHDESSLTIVSRPLSTVEPTTGLALIGLPSGSSGWLIEVGRCNRCNMPGADFSGQSLRGLQCNSCQLSSSNFSGADLTGAIFDRTIAEHGDFRHALMEGVQFKESKVNHSNFHGAHMKRAWFRGQVVIGGLPTEAQYSNFQGVNFFGATFEDSMMQYSIMKGTDIFNVMMGGNVHWDFAVWSMGEVFTHDFQCPVGVISKVGIMYDTNERQKSDAPHPCATSTNNLLNLNEPGYRPASGVDLYAGTSWFHEGTHFPPGTYYHQDFVDAYVGIAQARSARVAPGCRAIGYTNGDLTGRTIVLTGEHGVDYFQEQNMVGTISSMIVECPGLEKPAGVGLVVAPPYGELEVAEPMHLFDFWDDIEDFFDSEASEAIHIVDQAKAAIVSSLRDLTNEALGTFRDPAGRIYNPLMYLDRMHIPDFGDIDIPAVPKPPFVPDEYWPIPLPFHFPFPDWAPLSAFGSSGVCDVLGSVISSQATKQTGGRFRPMSTCGFDVRSGHGYFTFGHKYPGPKVPGGNKDQFFRYTVWQEGRFHPFCKATSRNFNVHFKDYSNPYPNLGYSIDDMWEVASQFPDLGSFGFDGIAGFKAKLASFFNTYGFDHRLAVSMAYGLRDDRFSLYFNVDDSLVDTVRATRLPQLIADAITRATGKSVNVHIGSDLSDNWSSEMGPLVLGSCPGQVIFGYLFGNTAVEYSE